MDLIMLANHKPGHIRIQGVRVDVLRGEVGWSEVALAARWRWSRGKVRRFMQELEDEKMLTKKRYTGQDKRNCLSTIVNYEKFQGEDSADDTSDSTRDGHATDMRRYTNKNEKNEKNEKKKDNTPLTPRRGECSYSASFEEFWSSYPLRKGKAAAYRAWKSVEKKHPGVKPPQIITAVKAQVEADTFRSPHDGQLYIPHPATWLNAGRWDDDVKPPGGAHDDPLAGLTLEQKFARARTPQ